MAGQSERWSDARLSRRRLLAAGALGGTAAFLSACGGGGDKPGASSAPATPGAAAASAVAAIPKPAGATPAFDALVAAAKASGKTELTGHFEADDPRIVRMWEAAFKDKFGIPLRITSIPGHAAREAPVQILAASRANKAIADFINSSTSSMWQNVEASDLSKPNWEALHEGFPLTKRLREAVPLLKNTKGEILSDYAMVSQTSIFVLAYNTKRVKPEEIKGIKYEDLTKPQWKGRVITDNQFQGVYQFPLAPGWSEARMVEWVKALKANGAKAVAGGSVGVNQALINGEGDITISNASQTLEDKKKGAPIDSTATADGWFSGLILCGTIPRLTLTDPALANLWLGWRLTEGAAILDVEGGGGARIFKEEKNGVTEMLKGFNYDFANMVFAKTDEDNTNFAKWRQLAIATYTAA